jgi:hypothetical protein
LEWFAIKSLQKIMKPANMDDLLERWLSGR